MEKANHSAAQRWWRTLPDDIDLLAASPASPAETSHYQQLRAHLTALKLTAAAEHLPAVPDAARAEDLSIIAALERPLAIEVNDTEARRLAGRLRFACLPPTPVAEVDRGCLTAPAPLFSYARRRLDNPKSIPMRPRR